MTSHDQAPGALTAIVGVALILGVATGHDRERQLLGQVRKANEMKVDARTAVADLRKQVETLAAAATNLPVADGTQTWGGCCVQNTDWALLCCIHVERVCCPVQKNTTKRNTKTGMAAFTIV